MASLSNLKGILGASDEEEGEWDGYEGDEYAGGLYEGDEYEDGMEVNGDIPPPPPPF